MYWPEVYDLAGFYETELGIAVARRINLRLDEIMPCIDSGTTLGIGYAMPYLQEDSGFAAMPPAGGALHWPEGGRSRSLVCKEGDLPLADDSLNCVIVAHALEFTRKPLHMMNEIWRVLVPEGKVVMIVPNRLGIWARAERTPFGDGKPFSPHQLDELIEGSNFNRLKIEQALFMPPTETPILLRAYGFFEGMSKFLPLPFGGVLIAVAEKKVLNPVRTRKGKNKPAHILEPAGAIQMSPHGRIA